MFLESCPSDYQTSQKQETPLVFGIRRIIRSCLSCPAVLNPILVLLYCSFSPQKPLDSTWSIFKSHLGAFWSTIFLSHPRQPYTGRILFFKSWVSLNTENVSATYIWPCLNGKMSRYGCCSFLLGLKYKFEPAHEQILRSSKLSSLYKFYSRLKRTTPLVMTPVFTLSASLLLHPVKHLVVTMEGTIVEVAVIPVVVGILAEVVVLRS